MNFWSHRAIQRTLAARWLIPPSDPDATLRGISTDTRSLAAGQAFLALRGEFFDGHAFLAHAADAGAACVILDTPEALTDAARSVLARRSTAALLVHDAASALLDLAAAYRETLTSTTVIAVTGSVGKTTAVRLIDAALGSALAGSASIKSFNNHIGVPLTILAARPEHNYLICEVGMNAPGEIAQLAAVVRPHIAVITAIGRAHIEQFGSVAAIAQEKASLLTYLEQDGVGVIPADDRLGAHLLADHAATIPNLLTFGEHPSANIHIMNASTNNTSHTEITLADRTAFRAPLIGLHHATNIAAAVAVARHLNIADPDIDQGLRSAQPADMRLSVREIGGITILNDAYNASPESTAAAVRTFAKLSQSATRRIMILGDMLELGQHTEHAHREIGQLIAQSCPPDLLVVVGQHAPLIADETPATQSRIYSHLENAQADRIADDLRPGDAVLIKGSRRLALERIADAIARRTLPGGTPHR